MGRRVKITLQTMIDDHGQLERHATSETGDFVRKGQLDVLTFDETLDSQIPPVRNMITIQKEKVNIKRSGPVTMNQQFLLHQHTENVYMHPHGSLHMETHTEKMHYHVNHSPFEGKLTIAYTVKLNGSEKRAHKLMLHFKEENE
ncbi:DUF1934 domain-containing protein [Virgibacillus sp. 179-BFC.A HS]|uniref:DUF1934 domain-containing protein n=1 Tax=Tigheibacillus jepli TaxID=3035914 RepID=A0ABU5CDY5_9BACI|nr:DUF1934 domain-containing protein [Virgibacillus sp. 179-BFC.A HS]MDY0404529.1 DUF1934 domain-containing protein [Virgibacillus sp. 179-BFC.A HS]